MKFIKDFISFCMGILGISIIFIVALGIPTIIVLLILNLLGVL